jgi:hypothetical protein
LRVKGRVVRCGLIRAGRTFPDLNLRGEPAVSDPIRLVWLAVTHGTGGAKPAFFEDMLELFRQLTGRSEHRPPSREQVRDPLIGLHDHAERMEERWPTCARWPTCRSWPLIATCSTRRRSARA